MKKWVFLFLSALVVAVIFVVLNWRAVKGYEPLRVLERLSLVENTLTVEVSPEINKDSLSISFIKYPDDVRVKKCDTIPIYAEGRLVNLIPDEYGKNRFVVRYKNIVYERIGLWKRKAWYKHDYFINISEVGDSVVVRWSIMDRNESYKGVDTLNYVGMKVFTH